MKRMWRLPVAFLATLGIAVGGVTVAQSSPEGPEVSPQSEGSPAPRWVVGLGDSYMSGEGATWAAKNYTSDFVWPFSKLGYWQVGTFGHNLQETYPYDFTGLPGDYCHRSASAPMILTDTQWTGVNLACSGATHRTQRAGVNGKTHNKPGVDFTIDGVGQASQLEAFAKDAKSRNESIDAVVVSIGGNDVGFADLVTFCATQFLTPLASACWRYKGDGDNPVDTTFDLINQTLAGHVTGALSDVHLAMQQAGYADGTYRILYQMPPIVVTSKNDIWSELGGDHSWNRQDYGGCPFTDGDLDMFHNDIGPAIKQEMTKGVVNAKRGGLANVPVNVLDPSFDGHELCQKYNTPKEINYNVNLTTPEWNNHSGQGGEWGAPVIVNGVVRSRSLEHMQENYPSLMTALNNDLNQADGLPMHPNYWGQRALAECHTKILRQPVDNAVFNCSPASPKGGPPLPLTNGKPTMNLTVQKQLGQ